MILDDIEAFTSIDRSVVSRATQNVVILSSKGSFTLNSTDASIERPSLFDEGSRRTDGKDCSRKEVLVNVKDIFGGEDDSSPITDEQASEILAKRGYDVARRTVTKYRMLLGIPSRAARRRTNSCGNLPEDSSCPGAGRP